MASLMTLDASRSADQPHDAHPSHAHLHDRWCGHAQVTHEDHLDYLHDGHRHAPHEGHYDEHDGVHATAGQPPHQAGTPAQEKAGQP